MDNSDVDHDKLFFIIENFLIQYGAPIYLHFFLRYNYDKIRSGEVTMIFAPSDEVMQRLSTQTNKSFDQISTTPEGIDFLDNFLSRTPIGEQYPVYTAINGTTFGKTRDDLHKLNIINTGYIGNVVVRVINSGIKRNDQQMQILSEAIPVQVVRQNSAIIGDNPIADFDDLPNPVIRQIALNLPPNNIIELCRLNAKFNSSICESEDFWNEKTRRDYPRHKGVIGGSQKETYRLTGRLFTFGDGKNGKLGHTDQQGRADQQDQLRPKLVEALGQVSFVSCGNIHTAAISNGLVYTFGYAVDGSLLQNVMRVPDLKRVTSVFSAEGKTDAISKGRLYVYAQIDVSEVPIAYRLTNRSQLQGDLPNVTSISDLVNRTGVISDGHLYVVGWGENGQLGLGNVTDVDEFELVNMDEHMQDLNNVTVVSCSDSHTAIISNDRLFTFGRGEHGQLGHGDLQDQNRPKLVEGLDNVTAVSVGGEHTAMISNGRLYTFGLGAVGQLGHGNSENQSRPKLVEHLENVTFVSCGDLHTAVISNNRLYTFGEGAHGELGHGDRQNQYRPKLVESLGTVSFVSCGINYTAAITQ